MVNSTTTPAPCELEDLLSKIRNVLTVEEWKKIEKHLSRKPPCKYCKEKLGTIFLRVTIDEDFLNNREKVRKKLHRKVTR